MVKKFTQLMLFIILLMVFCVACGNEPASEKKSNGTVEKFLKTAIKLSNSSNVNYGNYSPDEFYDVLKEEKIAKYLKSDRFKGSEEAEDRTRLLRTMMATLYNYELNDFIIEYDGEGVSVKIKENSIDKGIYRFNDHTDPILSFYVGDYTFSGVKIGEIGMRKPVVFEETNHYFWYAKDQLEDKLKIYSQYQQALETEGSPDKATLALVEALENEFNDDVILSKEQNIEYLDVTDDYGCVNNGVFKSTHINFELDSCMVVKGDLKESNKLIIENNSKSEEAFYLELNLQKIDEKTDLSTLELNLHDYYSLNKMLGYSDMIVHDWDIEGDKGVFVRFRSDEVIFNIKITYESNTIPSSPHNLIYSIQAYDYW